MGTQRHPPLQDRQTPGPASWVSVIFTIRPVAAGNLNGLLLSASRLREDHALFSDLYANGTIWTCHFRTRLSATGTRQLSGFRADKSIAPYQRENDVDGSL